jgi:hypothetical protein
VYGTKKATSDRPSSLEDGEPEVLLLLTGLEPAAQESLIFLASPTKQERVCSALRTETRPGINR